MKKLMELNFFNKSIFAMASYYGKFLKHSLAPNTPTMYLTMADTANNQKRRWHIQSITNCYCRACDVLMVIPGAIFNAQKNRSITCPSCGHVHSINNILIADNAQATLPLYARATLLELKNCLRLQFIYEAIILGNDVYNDFSGKNSVTEQFNFYYNDKKVVWKKMVNNTAESREIGFYADLLNPLSSILKYIPYSAQDRKGKKMSELIAYMRDYLTNKMNEQGYSKRKLFFNVAKSEMLERNLLYLARKIRFWDENETYEIYKSAGHHVKYDLQRLHLPSLEKKELELSNLLQQGFSYLDAFLTTFSLPNNRLVRKHIGYANVYPLSNAYSIGNDIFTANLIPYLLQNHNNVPAICGYYKYLAKYYPQKHLSDVINGNMRNLEDTVNLFKLLSKENLIKFENEKPHFKDLHNYLSPLVASQNSNEINYKIPEAILRRLDMQLRNSTCKVLTKYSQVLKAGIDLKNCAASYKKRINDNLQLVLISDYKGKAKVLLEIQNQSILQAKLWDNKKVKTDTEYNSIVKEFAKKAHLNINTNDISLEKDVLSTLAV